MLTKNLLLKKMDLLLTRIKFNPGIIGIFLNPFYFDRKFLYRAMANYAPQMGGRILDVGCGKKPYKHLFKCDEYVGMDVDQTGHSHKNEEIDVYYDGAVFPFPNDSFDNIVCSQVLEHVFKPQSFLTEINRVLKPGGHLLLTIPFMCGEHEQPFDYARYTRFGLSQLFKEQDLTIVSHEILGSGVWVIFQMINFLIYKATMRVRRVWIGNLLATLFLNAPINLMGCIIGWMFPKSQDLYLNSSVFAVKDVK